MYYTYILQSRNNKFYAGFTTNLKRRISEHTRGKVYSTKRLQSPRLVFYEAFICEQDARRRERYFKTTKGKKALLLMLRDSIK